MNQKQVKFCIAGAGNRGQAYSQYVLDNPELAKVVAVAEPRGHYREKMAQMHGITAENVFSDWKQMAEKSKLADAVIISTQDEMHCEPAIAFAKKGYHIMLEKPMAQNKEDCQAIVAAVIEADVIFAVCHVMRYTRYTRKLKEILDSGIIGEVVSIQHLEPVGYWHQAHSFVRGNWRNEEESSFMLLAKSCHDMDWLRHIAGSRCKKVSSFGNLKHFRKECKPEGAASRCLDCSCETECPYSAKKIYLDRAQQGNFGWPVDVLTTDLTIEGVTKALQEGPYGRCAYECDNDVVDHQVVNILFENGSTAVFTMTAFCQGSDRKTRIFGTRGQLYGDGSTIEHFDFLTNETNVVELGYSDGTIASGHGGGDYGIMKSFVEAVATGDRSKILSGVQETLKTHLSVFAAEESRKTGQVIEL